MTPQGIAYKHHFEQARMKIQVIKVLHTFSVDLLKI